MVSRSEEIDGRGREKLIGRERGTRGGKERMPIERERSIGANRLWKKDREGTKKEERKELANSQPDYKTSYKTKANERSAYSSVHHRRALSFYFTFSLSFPADRFCKEPCSALAEHARLNKRCLLAEFGNFLPTEVLLLFFSFFFFYFCFHFSLSLSPFPFLFLFLFPFLVSIRFPCSTLPGRLSPCKWNIQRDHSHSWRISLFCSWLVCKGCSKVFRMGFEAWV